MRKGCDAAEQHPMSLAGDTYCRIAEVYPILHQEVSTGNMIVDASSDHDEVADNDDPQDESAKPIPVKVTIYSHFAADAANTLYLCLNTYCY
jgi:hypothetical protein